LLGAVAPAHVVGVASCGYDIFVVERSPGPPPETCVHRYFLRELVARLRAVPSHAMFAPSPHTRCGTAPTLCSPQPSPPLQLRRVLGVSSASALPPLLLPHNGARKASPSPLCTPPHAHAVGSEGEGDGHLGRSVERTPVARRPPKHPAAATGPIPFPTEEVGSAGDPASPDTPDGGAGGGAHAPVTQPTLADFMASPETIRPSTVIVNAGDLPVEMRSRQQCAVCVMSLTPWGLFDGCTSSTTISSAAAVDPATAPRPPRVLVCGRCRGEGCQEDGNPMRITCERRGTSAVDLLPATGDRDVFFVTNGTEMACKGGHVRNRSSGGGWRGGFPHDLALQAVLPDVACEALKGMCRAVSRCSCVGLVGVRDRGWGRQNMGQCVRR